MELGVQFVIDSGLIQMQKWLAGQCNVHNVGKYLSIVNHSTPG